MNDSSNGPVYPAVTRLMHWLTLILLIGVFALGWIGPDIEDDDWRHLLVDIHRWLGLLVLLLALIRLPLWLSSLQRVLLPADMPAWQRHAAQAVQFLLLILLLAQPMLGWLYTNADGHTVSLFGLLQLPALVAENEALADQLIEWHEISAWLILILTGLHMAAALYHHFIRRDDVLVSMLPRLRVRR